MYFEELIAYINFLWRQNSSYLVPSVSVTGIYHQTGFILNFQIKPLSIVSQKSYNQIEHRVSVLKSKRNVSRVERGHFCRA